VVDTLPLLPYTPVVARMPLRRFQLFYPLLLCHKEEVRLSLFVSAALCEIFYEIHM